MWPYKQASVTVLIRVQNLEAKCFVHEVIVRHWELEVFVESAAGIDTEPDGPG